MEAVHRCYLSLGTRAVVLGAEKIAVAFRSQGSLDAVSLASRGIGGCLSLPVPLACFGWFEMRGMGGIGWSTSRNAYLWSIVRIIHSYSEFTIFTAVFI